MRALLDGLTRLLEVDEDRQLVLQDASGQRHGILGLDRAVGFNAHRQLVVVEDLAFARILDAIGDLLDRRVEAVDRDEADRCILGAITLGRHVALAGRSSEFHPDRCALIERADDVIGIEDLDVRGGLDVSGRGLPRALLL